MRSELVRISWFYLSVALAGCGAAGESHDALSEEEIASNANALGGLRVDLHDWGAGSVGYYQDFVVVCDNKADNRGIRAEYKTSNGQEDHVGDANGSDRGCGLEYPSKGGRITELNVCARNASTKKDIECTGWRPTP